MGQREYLRNFFEQKYACIHDLGIRTRPKRNHFDWEEKGGEPGSTSELDVEKVEGQVDWRLLKVPKEWAWGMVVEVEPTELKTRFIVQTTT